MAGPRCRFRSPPRLCSAPAPPDRAGRAPDDRLQQSIEPLACYGRDRQDFAIRRSVAGQPLGQPLANAFGAGQLGLGDGDDFDPVAESRIVPVELVADDFVVRHRIAAVGRGRLDQMDEDAGPLDMAKKLVSQARSAVRTLDQAGDVGQHEGAVAIDLHDAQVGIFGRERIVGDLGPGADRRLSRVLLPAFGLPTSPTSAITFSSRISVRLSPSPPGVNWRGARFVADLNRVFPLPPRAAAAGDDLIAGGGQVFEHVAGSGIDRRPCRGGRESRGPRHCGRGNWRCRRAGPTRRSSGWRCESSARLSTPGVATKITLPPLPPSPPSGPPRGTYFSRRKLKQPSPPRPARISI